MRSRSRASHVTRRVDWTGRGLGIGLIVRSPCSRQVQLPALASRRLIGQEIIHADVQSLELGHRSLQLVEMQQQPGDPLAFIKDCVGRGRLYWTYHVNMGLISRAISRELILAGVDTYEIVESYPNDKYFSSYLILSNAGDNPCHVLFATGVEGGNVRVVTAYRPDAREWESDMKRRRAP